MTSYSSTLILMLSLPFVLTMSRERWANFRYRRMPNANAQSGLVADAGHQPKRNSPFIIRVPYSKIVPSNALFSHSVSWKTKQTPPPTAFAKTADESSTTVPQTQTSAEVEVSQFHSQDINGQVLFGFNAPDQMRIEQRNADGTVHGTYSYLDPYGQIIKRQYWDTGAGFHVTSDSYPFGDQAVNGQNSPQNSGVGAVDAQYTPEVQAARDLHLQLYQQALASFLPSSVGVRQDLRRNNSVPNENDDSTSSQHHFANASNTIDAVIVTPSPSATVTDQVDSTLPPSSTSTTSTPAPIIRLDGDESVITAAADANQGSINIVEPDTENGSIVIQKPEYLRISWTTENKKYRVNPVAAAAATNLNDINWSEKSRTTDPSADNLDVTKLIMQSGRRFT